MNQLQPVRQVPPEKFCRECFKSKPIDDFRRRQAGTENRHSLCNECRNKRRRQATARRHEMEVLHFATRIQAKDHDLQALAALVREMSDRFGGVEKLAEAWYAALTAAMAKGQTAVAIRGFSSLFRLIEAAQKPQMDLAAHSDEQLYQVLLPEVVDMMIAGGWKVEPPAETPE